MAMLYNDVLDVLSLNIYLSLALIFQAQFIVLAITTVNSADFVCNLPRHTLLSFFRVELHYE